jgi:hypothetical protein
VPFVEVGQMNIDCSGLDLESYEKFLAAKLSPFYNVNGRIVTIKDVGLKADELGKIELNESHLFDYQKFILNIAINKKHNQRENS